jgi:toxin YhaV
MTVNGWNLFYFHLFKQILDKLEMEVTALAKKDPEGFIHHKKAKLLKAVVDNIKIEVPQHPDHRDFWLGGTLGNDYKDWRRVKHRLPPRYRLFFKFASSNKRSGIVPNSFEDLLKNSSETK